MDSKILGINTDRLCAFIFNFVINSRHCIISLLRLYCAEIAIFLMLKQAWALLCFQAWVMENITQSHFEMGNEPHHRHHKGCGHMTHMYGGNNKCNAPNVKKCKKM